MANRELLLRTLEYIREHPEQHDQSNYMSDCGTTFCFAGWATILHTGKRPSLDLVTPGATLWWVDEDTGEQIGYEGRVDGVPVYEFAKKILGLSELHADLLFLQALTMEMVAGTVDYILEKDDAES